MLPALVAGAIGAAIGALRRPHGRHLRSPVVVYPAVVLIGVALQVATGMVDLSIQGALLGSSLGALTGFSLVNRHLPGMGVLSVGLALNMAVVLANGAMPVRASALVDAGAASADALADADPGAGRRFEQAGDALPFLGDIIPVPAFRAALSFGDLIALMGIGAVSGDLVRHARRGSSALGRRRRFESQNGRELLVDLDAVGRPQHGTDVEELTALIDLVDAEDRVWDDPDGESHRREGPGVPVSRRRAGDRPDEVLPGEREQHRSTETVQ